jgi:hypothetical protein
MYRILTNRETQCLLLIDDQTSSIVSVSERERKREERERERERSHVIFVVSRNNGFVKITLSHYMIMQN